MSFRSFLYENFDEASRASIESGIVVPSLHRLRGALDGAAVAGVAVALQAGRVVFEMTVAAPHDASPHDALAAIGREFAADHDALRLDAEAGRNGQWTLRVALPART